MTTPLAVTGMPSAGQSELPCRRHDLGRPIEKFSIPSRGSLPQPFPVIPEETSGYSQERNTYRDGENVSASNDDGGTEKARYVDSCNHRYFVGGYSPSRPTIP
jgi:hypothetical protein